METTVKKGKNKIIPLACLALFLLSLLSFARGAAAEQNYIEGKLGVYSPESNDLSGFSSDFAGEAAFGHYFNRNVAAEFGVGYLRTSAVEFDRVNDIFVTEDINATFITGTVKLVFPVPYYYPQSYPYFDLYAGAGVGLYFANDNIDVLGLHQNDTVGGFHILGGADFNIDRNFFLGFEGKYLWARPFDTNIDGLVFTGNFGYRF
ncbi:MAG: outer membrane beta-barrel protein [Nitrospiraceae bacterium]|nr:outer membrane beta-barrel protein [Nitrospiraceae bacterium]